MARRRRDRPRTDDTNWRLRDNVTWYTDQAKAVPGLARELVSAPREWVRELRAIGRDMRDDENRPPDAKK